RSSGLAGRGPNGDSMRKRDRDQRPLGSVAQRPEGLVAFGPSRERPLRCGPEPGGGDRVERAWPKPALLAASSQDGPNERPRPGDQRPYPLRATELVRG